LEVRYWALNVEWFPLDPWQGRASHHSFFPSLLPTEKVSERKMDTVSLVMRRKAPFFVANQHLTNRGPANA
jgi:hypothetical protein